MAFQAYVAISTAISLSFAAFAVDHFQILFLIIISFAVLGFMFLNFPMGKIFLGDAGAYVLGHHLCGQQLCWLILTL